MRRTGREAASDSDSQANMLVIIDATCFPRRDENSIDEFAFCQSLKSRKQCTRGIAGDAREIVPIGQGPAGILYRARFRTIPNAPGRHLASRFSSLAKALAAGVAR